MARDSGFESLVAADLQHLEGLTQQGMFGGWMWLLHGHLLCGARKEGLLMRLGKGRDAWALAIEDITPMLSGTRRMQGWVRVAPSRAGDAALRRRLIDASVEFVRTLPPK